MEFVDLHTERLWLRQPIESDVDRITDLCQDDEIAAFTTVPVPYRREHAASFVHQVIPDGWASGTSLCGGICSTDRPDLLLGVVSIAGIEGGIGKLGYWTGAGSRGSGMTTEAARRVLQFAFASSPDGLALNRVEWEALSGNTGSARVAQKLGFRWEGLRRSAITRFGQPHDLTIAGLLRDDPAASPAHWPTTE